jgi:DNA (cytosine-5)-methyltransferase 1
MKSSNPHSGIYEAETTRTLDLNGGSPACNQGGMAVVCLNDQGGQQMNVSEDISGTLRAQEHGHQPIVIEGNGSRESHRGDGYKESETMFTLNTVEQHAVCVSQDAYDKFFENEKSASLKACGGSYGGAEPITASKAGFFLNARNNGKADTLVATDYKDPQVICYGLDRASFNQGRNAQYGFSVTEEQAQTLVAKGPGGVLTRQSGPYVQEITKE